MGFADFLKSYGASVAWLVAAIGWIVGNVQANRRERRKELRSEIEDVARLVKDVATETKKFYRSTPGSPEHVECVVTVQALVREIDVRIERLKRGGLAYFSAALRDATASAQERYFDETTGGSFGTSARPSGANLTNVLLRHHAAGLALIESLHAQFSREFNGHFFDN